MQFKKLNAHTWQLLKPVKAGNIEVPKGFITDGASIPSNLKPFFPSQAAPSLASITHDYLYATHLKPKLQADWLFLTLLKKQGVSLAKRWVMFLSVALFGFGAWHKNKLRIIKKY